MSASIDRCILPHGVCVAFLLYFCSYHSLARPKLSPVLSTIMVIASPLASRLASCTLRCLTLTSSAANRSHS
ncbi:MAG: hypothetical protein QOF74_467 [Caballeronia mineralivorans]|nr:hypothetical protein [Caballeronia mineralivorans]